MADITAAPPRTDAPTSAPTGVLPPPTGLKGRKAEEEERPTTEVLDALSKEKPVSPKEATSALEWFLSEDPDEATGDTHTIDLNVGGVGDAEQWIQWAIRPIDSDELRRIQRETAAQRRRGGRAAQDDMAIDLLANLRVIVECSVDPDLKAAAQQARARSGRAVAAQVPPQAGTHHPDRQRDHGPLGLRRRGCQGGDHCPKLIKAGGEAQLLFLAWRYGGDDDPVPDVQRTRRRLPAAGSSGGSAAPAGLPRHGCATSCTAAGSSRLRTKGSWRARNRRQRLGEGRRRGAEWHGTKVRGGPTRVGSSGWGWQD